MRICIVDDEKNCIDTLKGLLEEYDASRSLDMEFDIFSDGESFKSAYAPEKYDIVFLDIYIGETTGMELANHVRALSENGMIIFCTTSVSDMPEAFRFHAFEYIIKPATYERVERIMDDAVAILPRLEKYIDIHSGKDRLHFALSALISATTSGHYLNITTRDGDTNTVRMTMTEFKSLLNEEERFITINKGILVNMDYIANIADRTCTMNNGESFPIKVREASSIRTSW